MAIAEPLRRAEGDGAIELVADIGFILRIVEKHFALNHLHAGTLRGAHGLGCCRW